MYLIKSGCVAIGKISGDEQITLSTLGKGEIFGEMALLGNSYRSATARAKENTICYVLSEVEFNSHLEELPAFMRSILYSLVNSAKQLTDSHINSIGSN